MGDKSNCSVICTLFKIAFLGKWNKCGECPFLWPLTSFPDRRTYMYSVHSVQYCLSSCYEEFYETLHLKRLALGEWHWKSLHVTRIVAIWQAMRYFLFVVCKEVTAALKKLNKHKIPGLSGLVAEMIQATGDIRTQWILVLCNGILKEGAFQRIGSQVLYYKFTKAKVTQWTMDLTEGLNWCGCPPAGLIHRLSMYQSGVGVHPSVWPIDIE